MGSRTALSLLAVALQCGCTGPALPRFEATLAATDSATKGLATWCQARHLASPARISARQIKGDDAPRPADAAAFTGYRHVRLSCGNFVLSEAHNWYARARLSPEMNRVLDTTDTPFGTVAAPLGFRRERLSAARGAAQGCPRGTILSHRARLVLPDGQPLALVVECYTQANLKS